MGECVSSNPYPSGLYSRQIGEVLVLFLVIDNFSSESLCEFFRVHSGVFELSIYADETSVLVGDSLEES